MPAEDERTGVAVADDGCKLAYKLRGNPLARHKVIMVMGFACCQDYWGAQLHLLDDDSDEDLEMLAFDNRGTGESDRPVQCYTTSQLASDAVRVLETVGWIPWMDRQQSESGRSDRSPSPVPRESQLHVVGWSLGGMIAQELGLMLMDRGTCASSLAIACSHSGGWRYLPPFSSLFTILKVMTALSTEGRIDRVLLLHHTEEFLNKDLDSESLPHLRKWNHSTRVKKVKRGNSNKDLLVEAYQSRSPFTGPLWWNMPALIGHMLAVTTHHVSNDRLARLGGAAGPRCVVISAGKDGLMDHRHAHDLAVAMRGDTELYEFSANGHMVNVERTEEFNAILKHHFLRSARSRTRTATAGRDLDNIDDGMGLLRGQLIDADCRRYKSVELRDDRWDNPLEMTLKMVMGWSLRFALFLPLMIALRSTSRCVSAALRIVLFISSLLPVDLAKILVRQAIHSLVFAALTHEFGRVRYGAQAFGKL
mmetsp:Transcript_5993/g.9508  ORF Transcript_5993/g.9508 Transcript_5993/m.9508 type:complete len:478 (-) Transcript_5993:265-1698(-)